MNILIFEGIASSGKTTIEKRLIENLSGAEIITEDQTLMPLIDNCDESVSKKHLNHLLNKIEKMDCEYLILDRFHVTHAFRTTTEIKMFEDIENRLLELGKPLVVLLTIRPQNLRKRIEETVNCRKDGWKKGSQGAITISEKVAYYTKQQERLQKIVAQSILPSMSIDTTDKMWDEASQKILERLHIRYSCARS